ncbi:MAG TPA: hypothetical protein DDX54_03625 [Rhodospirillaceae bacterium]|jgi:flagellar motility protein MotE (MotC chaperone)|nr:hypothetical protein [Alphaproteobacteria bacterium]HBH26473.1 hypothetical protein [Rhodospirillaceae bacterium]
MAQDTISRFRLLPVVLGLASLAFIAHGVSLARAVEMMKEESESPPAFETGTEENAEKDDQSLAPPESYAPPPGGWTDPEDTDAGGADARAAAEEGLAARAKALDARAVELDNRAALLAATQKALEEKVAALEALREEASVVVEARTQAQGKQVARLVKIYEGMKPADAARLFDAQDPALSVAVMRGMSARKLSPILAAMEADRARTLTAMLARPAPPQRPAPDPEGQAQAQ